MLFAPAVANTTEFRGLKACTTTARVNPGSTQPRWKTESIFLFRFGYHPVSDQVFKSAPTEAHTTAHGGGQGARAAQSLVLAPFEPIHSKHKRLAPRCSI
eukprot:6464936-Amphidinium_carterae.1